MTAYQGYTESPEKIAARWARICKQAEAYAARAELVDKIVTDDLRETIKNKIMIVFPEIEQAPAA